MTVHRLLFLDCLDSRVTLFTDLAPLFFEIEDGFEDLELDFLATDVLELFTFGRLDREEILFTFRFLVSVGLLLREDTDELDRADPENVFLLFFELSVFFRLVFSFDGTSSFRFFRTVCRSLRPELFSFLRVSCFRISIVGRDRLSSREAP